MESGDGDGSSLIELQPVVSELGSTAHEARIHAQQELTGAELTVRADEVRTLRRELATARRELRRLEQYVVAAEERLDDG